MRAMRLVAVIATFHVALRLGMASGLPAWRDWPPFDAHDVAAIAAAAVWLAMTRRQVPAHPAPSDGDVR